jgi:hypothetical protein
MPIAESLALTRGRLNEFLAQGIRLIPQRFGQDRTASLDASRSPPGDFVNTSTDLVVVFVQLGRVTVRGSPTSSMTVDPAGTPTPPISVSIAAFR